MRRILIAILTVIWGILVFFPGSVLVEAAVQRAALAMLPLIVAGFLVVDQGMGWRKYLRRVYAVLLATFGGLIWGGLNSIPYLITSVVLLWPEIRGCFFQGGWHRALISNGLIFGALGSFIWWHWFHNPLPSDQQLIDQFNAHRQEFEQLAQGYRNHRTQGFYDAKAEVLTLMRKAGVNRIVEAGGQFGMWLPEPYSEHTLQVRKFLEVRPIERMSTKEEKLETYHREFPQLFDNTPPVETLYEFSRLVHPIKFRLGPDPAIVPWGVTSLRYFGSLLNKGFCYYPQPPRVENGHIVDASFSLMDNVYTRSGLRVFDSLDQFPPDWKRGECVVKRIDENWFIFMCRVAL